MAFELIKVPPHPPHPPTPQAHSPPVHLHVLSIEEEDGGWDESDVEVLCVDRDTVSIHYEDVRHLRHGMLVLGKLRDMHMFTVAYITL